MYVGPKQSPTATKRMPGSPPKPGASSAATIDQADFFDARSVATGEPLLVPIDVLDEDSGNPRTEFPEPEIRDLADDTAAHRVLQPVVDSADRAGRRCTRSDAKGLRAARMAGLAQVPSLAEFTRTAVAFLKKAHRTRRGPTQRRHVASPDFSHWPSRGCARLESLLGRITKPDAQVTPDELAALRRHPRQRVGVGPSDPVDPSSRTFHRVVGMDRDGATKETNAG